MYHMELAADLATHALTLGHYIHVWYLHGFGLHLIDALLLLDMRSVFVAAKQRIAGYIRYKTATYNLNHAFPDASQQLLSASDQDCAICRDRLSAAKLLPCGHLFHLSCLRAWLQQSGSNNFTCPVCRKALYVSSSTWIAAQQLQQSMEGTGMHPHDQHQHNAYLAGHHQHPHQWQQEQQQQRQLGAEPHHHQQHGEEEEVDWRQIAAAAGLDEGEFQWQQALGAAARWEEEHQMLMQGAVSHSNPPTANRVTARATTAVAAAAYVQSDDLADAWVQQGAQQHQQQQWGEERVVRQPPTLLPWQGGHSPPGVQLGGPLPTDPSRGRGEGGPEGVRWGEEGQGVGLGLWRFLGVAFSGLMYWSVVRAASAASGGSRGRSRGEELEAAIGRSAAARSGGDLGRHPGGGGGVGSHGGQEQQQQQGMYAASEDTDSIRDDPLDDDSGEYGDAG